MKAKFPSNRRTFIKKSIALFSGLTVLSTMVRPSVAKSKEPLPQPEPSAQGYRLTEHIKKYYETARI
ncbi:MAG: Formate dehydrogenase [Thermodesulfobacteriota bacterium]|nr:Formate dehydrogenase [Thermodesulfobacteriota bacterium]